jgi:hypothetical protein
MNAVDVIVPCHRYGHFLKQCVDSVLTQSAVSVRVLIIDDASPDNTAEVASKLARSDARVSLVRHESNKGHIATYNEGIDWVRADYLLLLSADDYLLPGALSRATRLMDKHPEIGFTFGNVIVLHEQGGRELTDLLRCKDGKRVFSGSEFMVQSGVRNLVFTPTAVVRTKLQKQLGGYLSELPHSGDMEMWLRLAAHGSVGFIESPQAVRRRHACNMSLGYMTQGWLPDLKQRKAALDCFFGSCADVIPHSAQLRGRLLYLLGCDAICRASEAFNEGEQDLAERLCSFAISVSSGVTRSLPWIKLACKRRMGLRMWRSLQPFAECLRLSTRFDATKQVES